VRDDATNSPPLRSPVTDRVRVLLITPDDDLLTIKRVRTGQDPYWVLPGGGVEAGEDLETALARKLREELAAIADVHSLLPPVRPADPEPVRGVIPGGHRRD
jgi:ADP-ribose pyrophosphatase YjhB (NUDIX family)